MWGAAVSVLRCSPASLALGTARNSCSIFCSGAGPADWANVELAAKESRTTADVSSRRVNRAPEGWSGSQDEVSDYTKVQRRQEGAVATEANSLE